MNYGGPERLPITTADRIAQLAGLMTDMPDYARLSKKVWPRHIQAKQEQKEMGPFLNGGQVQSATPESLRGGP